MTKKGYNYILFSRKNGTLYVGVTNDLKRRITEHKEGRYNTAFSFRYCVNKLGYFEEHQSIIEAIQREKFLKKFSRKRKIALIEKFNPNWEDLYYQL
jgi:putative endonuclease